MNLKIPPLHQNSLNWRLPQIPDGKLKQKMQDVSLLYTTYTAMLGNSYRDPSDDLTQATERAKGSRFFENTHVFLYGFVSFSQQQFRMLSLMLEQGDVTIALNGEKEDSSLFHTIRQTASSLKRMATKLGVSIKKPIYLTSRMENQELLFLQRHILRPQVEEYPQTSSSIKVLLASNEYSEIDEILSEIWKLVQEGYHFRDIALVTHDMEHYRNILESSLKNIRSLILWMKRFRFKTTLLCSAPYFYYRPRRHRIYIVWWEF